MALVLEVVKDGDLRDAGPAGRGEARVHEDIDALAPQGAGQRKLLVEQAPGTKRAAHRQNDGVRTDGAGLAVGKNNKLVFCSEPIQLAHEFAQVNFGTADPARDDVERVQPDAHVPIELRTARVRPTSGPATPPGLPD
jgi:hypothetical protein